MKLTIASITLVASCGVVAAFNAPAFVTQTAHSTSTTSLSATAQLTRFEKLKKNYKGPTVTVADELDFSYEDFNAAVEATDYAFNRNDVVKGTVVQYDNGGCIVDIGAKASAFLPVAEAALVQEQGGSNIESLVDIDAEMDFQIISEEDENGQLIVSVRRIQYRQAWDTVTSMQSEDDVFEAEVVAINRGGAICLVAGLRAFLPGSHLTGQLPTEDLIGQTVPLKFLEVSQEANKLVVSNRRAVVEQQMADLSRGDVIDGMVKALKPYGAFVEVGGMSGLLHISQISYDRIDNLEKVFQIGDRVKCMIIDHDKVNGRIALSTKSLEPEPGDMLKDPARVFDLAEDTAKKYHERMEMERIAREEDTKNIVLGLGDSLDALDGDEVNGDEKNEAADPLADVNDSLDSLLS
jgi:small subunit ribosomal protein S1